MTVTFPSPARQEHQALRQALIAPSYAGLYLEAMQSAARMIEPPKGALAISGGESMPRLYEMVGNIAIIGVNGILVSKFPYIGCPWATGYDALRCQLAQAFADPEVAGIVLDIESGGGDVAGCFDLVDWIAVAKATAQKPVAAILTEYAYSAAYAIASVADTIAVPRTGGVGSIGVVMLHVDMSGWLKQIGIEPTFIYAGSHKVDGNFYEPLQSDVKERWQAECEDIRNLFCATVARNRASAGVKLTLKDLLATEAAIYSGPAGLGDAVKLGLADEILAPADAFARIQRDLSGAIA